MNRKRFTAVALSSLLMLLSTFPAYAAGTWTAHDDGTWTYLNEDGENVVGWIKDGDDTYHLDKDGLKTTGWFKSKGAWYYFDEDGVMASNTWIDNYYVNSDGKWKGTR